MSTISRQVQLASRPTGFPTRENFNIADVELPPIEDGQILIRVIYMSLDPYMRGRMDDGKSYATPVPVGGVMEGGSVGEVIESKNPKFAVGAYVMSRFGWQTHAISDGHGVRTLDPAQAPISTSVGVLGMPGLTAYVGLLDIGQPKEGETVVVSAASGAVGAVVGQIAKIKGCRVVGIAGAQEKCDYVVKELGFDACVSHHSDSLEQDLADACPKGIDVYFENVSGKVFEAVLPLMNMFGRIPVCGLIANYNMTQLPKGPDKSARIMRAILTNRLMFQGYIVSDRYDRHDAFQKDVSAWIRSGELKYREDIAEGLDNAPETFFGLLKGKNFGKQLVRLSNDPTRG